jgi:uncharacterized protein (UPF0262 family)
MKKRSSIISKARLDALLEQATLDCYGESEQIVGIFTMIEENLQLPFETAVLGSPVTITSVELTDNEQIVAICVRGRDRQSIPIVDLPLPSPPSAGAEWIEVYRHYLGHQ